MDQYYILGGVRRSVAARQAGGSDIPAKLHRDGQPDMHFRVDLDCLHSPKDEVVGDYRYIRYSEYTIAVMKLDPDPIEMETLGVAGQTGSVPLSQVRLV